MNKIEMIKAAIKAEQDKVYYLSLAQDPGVEFQTIFTKVLYLNRLLAAEEAK